MCVILVAGYSAAALLAILFAIPFGLRVLIHKESGRWSNLPQAFYHVHLELFLGNACLGKLAFSFLWCLACFQNPFVGYPCLYI